METKNFTITINVDTSEFDEAIYEYKRKLNEWISVQDELPQWYIPVLVLTDGDYRTNPFCDKVKVCWRYDINEYKWNNNFMCGKKVFYWAYLSDIPQDFNKEIKRYQIDNQIKELEKEKENL